MNTEQKIGNSLSSACTGIPGKQDCICMILCVRNIDSASGHEDYDRRFSGFQNFFHEDSLGFGKQKIFFVTGKIAVSGISLFSLKRFVKPEDEDDSVAVFGNGKSFSESVALLRQRFDSVLA